MITSCLHLLPFATLYWVTVCFHFIDYVLLPLFLSSGIYCIFKIYIKLLFFSTSLLFPLRTSKSSPNVLVQLGSAWKHDNSFPLGLFTLPPLPHWFSRHIWYSPIKQMLGRKPTFPFSWLLFFASVFLTLHQHFLSRKTKIKEGCYTLLFRTLESQNSLYFPSSPHNRYWGGAKRILRELEPAP